MEECVVDEGDGELEVCIVVTYPKLDCPVIFPFEMIFSATPGTASQLGLHYNLFVLFMPLFYSTGANEDYKLGTTLLRFGACETRSCWNVSIVDNLLLEDTENFTLHLEKSHGLSNDFRIDPSLKVISITDDDGVSVFDSLFHL